MGFVDGTVRPICRPNRNQWEVYNGHKRVHSLKFQSVVAPNAIIANLFGPVKGKRHDAAMLVMSGLLDELERCSFAPNGQALCIYGDPVYSLQERSKERFESCREDVYCLCSSTKRSNLPLWIKYGNLL